MDYSMISPAFFDKLTDKNNPDAEGLQYTITITPSGVEQFFPLMQEKVVRTLIDDKSSMMFMAKKIAPKQAEKYIKQSEALIEKFPLIKYYGFGKSILMNSIQDRNFSIEKRFLLMNYGIKTIQNLIDTGKEAEIPEFTGFFMNHKDKSDIINLFKELSPNMAFSAIDALSFINSLPDTKKLLEVKKVIFPKLDYKEDRSDFTKEPFDKRLEKYIGIKKNFFQNILKQGTDESKEYYLENIMIGFIWTMNMPLSDFRLNLWDNFAFTNMLFNAVKVLLTLYVTEDNVDEDVITAITALDESMRAVNNGLVSLTVDALNKRGFNTNGDMAVLALS